MKKVVLMLALVFYPAGSLWAATWVMNPEALAVINAMLLDAGHGNFIAQSGTITADLSYPKQSTDPTINDLICIDTKTNGMVRVRIIRNHPGYKITEVKEIK